MFPRPSLALAAATLALAAMVAPVGAAAVDPAAAQIARFDAALARAAHGGAGAATRARVIAPAVDAVFDAPAMAQFAIGPAWSGFSAPDRARLTAAFKRLIAANYAKNFGDPGTRFDLAPAVETRGPDKLVQCRIGAGAAPGALVIYRMRQSGGSWRVIDVLFNGTISELTTERSEFAAPLAAGGPKALAAHIDGEVAKLLR